MEIFWVCKLILLFITGAFYLKKNSYKKRKYRLTFLSLLFSFFSGLGLYFFYEFFAPNEKEWMPILLVFDLFPLVFLMEYSFRKEEDTLREDLFSLYGRTHKNYTPYESVSRDLLGNLSREIQKPAKSIESIIAYLNVNMNYELSESIVEKIQLIQLNAIRISGVFQKIDDFSKISRNEITLNLEIFDAHQAIQDVLEEKKSEYKFLKVVIENYTEQNLNINADRIKINQIFYYIISELLINSNSKKILIQTARLKDKESFIKFIILNKELHLSQEDSSRVFSPISRIENDMFIYDSNSLGLTLSKYLIELHGGELWNDPDLSFKNNICFTLPLQNEKDPMEERQSKLEIKFSENQTEENPYTILVVDDEPVNHLILKSLLNHINFHVITITSGFEALYLIENEITPDIIIIDINMPEMNGLELTKEIRKKYTPQEIPIILITMSEFTSEIDEIFQIGANDILTKPFVKTILIHRISTLMELRRLALKNKRHSLLEHELSVARKLQVKLLPGRKPETPGVNFESLYIPMTYLAGDFYDYFEDEHGIGILLADVTGHGIPAAMVASMVKATFRSLREKISEPSIVMKVLNQILVGNDNQFLTAVYVYIDVKKKILYSANAGHPPVILIDTKGNLIELKSKGKLIGFSLELDWETSVYKLEGTERLVLYTDGIIEIKNFNGELLGEENFFEFLKSNLYMNPKDLIETSKRMIYDFSFQVSQEDDLTMLVVDFKSPL